LFFRIFLAIIPERNSTTMKHVRLLLLMLIVSSTVLGQDVILLKDGSEIKAKVTEIGVQEIKYKKFDNLEGPVYSLRKTDVFMITYENGQKEVIKAEEQPAGNQPGQQGRVQQQPQMSISSRDIRKTRTASTFGYIMAAPILGFAGAAAASDEVVPGATLGGMATLSLGISAPIIAGRARRTREITGVEGSYSARLAGWIFYGIAMADAVTLLGLNFADVYIPDGTVIAVGVVGAASSILFGIDAGQTARESKQYVGDWNLSPTMNISKDRFGNQFTSVGLQLSF
jgi:hypothetical protein